MVNLQENKPKALLLLTHYDNNYKDAVSATLGWMCEAAGFGFDVYYDAYRLGQHHGGSNYSRQPYGQAFGSTVLGGNHLEQFFLLNTLFDASYLVAGENHLVEIAERMHRPMLHVPNYLLDIYTLVADYLGVPFPDNLTVFPESLEKAPSLSPFCFPEVFFRKSLGILSDTDEGELLGFLKKGIKKIYSIAVPKEKIEKYIELGFNVEEVVLGDVKHYIEVVINISRRWLSRSTGFFIGDPVLVSYYIPYLCRKKLLPLYSYPLIDVIKDMANEITAKSDVIYGRHDDERETMELSLLNKSIQPVDPGRPPFTLMINRRNALEQKAVSIGETGYMDEVSDEELLQYAKEGKILSTFLFWAPDMRHTECFYSLFDLITVMKFRCGLLLTTGAYDYSISSPIDLINIPLEQGGVYPYIEPLLCSCGLGVAFEAYMSVDKLVSQIRDSLAYIQSIANTRVLGWYPALDSKLKAVKKKSKRNRPWDNYLPEYPNMDLWRAIESLNFAYALTQFYCQKPFAIKGEGDFISFNQTAGNWDGWTPLISISSFSDLLYAERKTLTYNFPAWIVGTIDAPLWLYSYYNWDRCQELRKMLDYVKRGGLFNKLVNVSPSTIARYIKILIKEGFLKKDNGGSYTLENNQRGNNLRYFNAKCRYVYEKVRNKIEFCRQI